MDNKLKEKEPIFEFTFKEGSPHLIAYSDNTGDFVHCFHMDKVPPAVCHKCEGDFRKISLAFGTKGFYVSKVRCYSCGKWLYDIDK